MTQYRVIPDLDSDGFFVQRRSWRAPWWHTVHTKAAFGGLGVADPRVFKTREDAALYVERALTPPLLKAGRLFGQ